MKKWVIPLLLCLLFCGCSNVFDGSYSSVRPHAQPSAPVADRKLAASDRDELYKVVAGLMETGKENAVINVAAYDQIRVEADMRIVCTEVKRNDPVAAYAVEDVTYELGKSEGQSALVVTISYRHDRTQIDNIRYVETIASAAEEICGALDRCEGSIVLYIDQYEPTDFLQIVEDHAIEAPHLVMEVPQVAVCVYPDGGRARVVEVSFTYQTSRESLKAMQDEIAPVFASAALYVSPSAEDQQKYAQLSNFLMERFDDHQIKTSITPTYSLLCYGVGDSRAFAVVYAAMCRQIGLECIAVSGTKDGQNYYWNIICEDGVYYHIDLLDSRSKEMTDDQMGRYVWDYGAYPVCDGSVSSPLSKLI